MDTNSKKRRHENDGLKSNNVTGDVAKKKANLLTLSDGATTSSSSTITGTTTTSTTDESFRSTLGVFTNGDIASVIFPFLDVRELYNLAFSNKTLLASLRHEHVVRSAVLHGGHAKTTASSVCRLVEERKIFIPSPRRFLCMVNGKHCERKGCNGNLNVARPDYGLFMCWDCCQRWTKKVIRNKKWMPLLEEPRTAGASYGSGVYIFQLPYRDTTGDLAGPLLTMSDLGRQGTLKQILAKCDALDPHVSSIDEIVRTWKDSKEAAVTREQEREEVKKQKTKMADKNRQEKTRKIIESLSLLLEHKEWKEIALSHKWKDLKVYRDRKRVPMVSFKCGVVNSSMQSFLVAPSKANKKAIQAVADQITGTFDMIYAKHFHDFSFLSNDLPFERKIRLYCEVRYAGGQLLMTPNMDGYVVTKIEKGKLLEGLEYLIGRSAFCDIVGKAFLWDEVVVVEQHFLERAEKMARTLWEKERYRRRDPPQSYEENYQECVTIFPRLFAAAKEFLVYPAAVEATTGSNPYPLGVLQYIWSTESTFEPLLEGNFKDALKIILDIYSRSQW
jgi:hypothetical protein